MTYGRGRGRSGALLGWLAATLVVALLVAGQASAQDTSSSIRGVVRDASGPLAGATVAATDSTSGFRQSATAGADGRFVVAGLKPGVYEVTVSSQAYQEQSQAIQVLLGQDLNLDFVLSPSEVYLEGISVVGTSTQIPIDLRSSEISYNVTPQQIQNLPQNSRNFLSFAALAPGVRFTDDPDVAGQKFRSGGADARQVNVFIDGLSYKNDLLQGGAFMQDSSKGNPFPQNAVQEYKVLTQNYKAEYEKAAAAVITAVTRSGGNELAGDVFYFYQDKGLVSQDDFSKERGQEKPDYERMQAGASIGGPIQRDRLHFFVTAERNEQDRNATVARGSDFANAPANVQQLLSGYATGVQTSPFESTLAFGKLSWQPAPGKTLDVSFNLRDEEEIADFGGQRVREQASQFEIGTEALVAKHTWVFGNALNEASLAYQSQDWEPTALTPTTPRLNYIGILDVGGKDSTQHFQQDRLALRDDVSYLLTWRGDHSLKAGLGVARLDYEVEKRLFDNPLFEFRRDESWQFPFQARLGFGDPGLSFSNTQVGLYVQDDWAVTPRLTLNLGVRWDYESNMINNDYETPPDLVAAMQSACRTYGQPVGGQSTWCLRDFFDFSRYTTDGSDRDDYYGMVQPRFGFSWDVQGDAKTVVFGGWGKYYDRVILNDIFDEEYRQDWGIYSFCFSADGSPAPNCGVPSLAWRPEFQSADGLRNLIASGQAAGPEVWLVANDLRPPRSTQWTLGVRRELGSWLASLSYANSRGHNGLAYFFGDLPPGTPFGERFGGNVQIPGYARVFITSTARRTWYDGYFLTLDRPFTADSRWGANIAYTYADAYQNGTDNPFEGISFGAFDYGSSADYFKFPASNSEKHRLVASGTVALPWSFQLSSIVTLGSGVPFTVFDDSVAPFTVRWNEGEPAKQDFIVSDAFAYRSVDLRLQWDAPKIADEVQVTLIAEAFNVFDFDNYKDFESFKPRLPNVNARFGEPNAEFNTRRLQFGARVSF